MLYNSQIIMFNLLINENIKISIFSIDDIIQIIFLLIFYLILTMMSNQNTNERRYLHQWYIDNATELPIPGMLFS